jgi:hypothetical protein
MTLDHRDDFTVGGLAMELERTKTVGNEVGNTSHHFSASKKTPNERSYCRMIIAVIAA